MDPAPESLPFSPPPGAILLAWRGSLARHLFRGRHACVSYANYAGAQLARMETRAPAERPYAYMAVGDLLTRWRACQKKGENLDRLGEKRKRLILQHGYDAKNAAYSVRLLRMCREFLVSGEMTVYRSDAAELLEIADGQWPLERVQRHAAELFDAPREARDASSLPDAPDREAVERLLVSILTDWFRTPEGP